MRTPQYDWHAWLPQWAPAVTVLCALVSAVFYVGGELKRLDHLEQGLLQLEQRLEQRITRMEARMETLFAELRDEIREIREDRRNVANDIADLRERVSALEAKDG